MSALSQHDVVLKERNRTMLIMFGASSVEVVLDRVVKLPT
jgi:hypothetical protein